MSLILSFINTFVFRRATIILTLSFCVLIFAEIIPLGL
uniref:Type I inositol polyphosphate 5-phosphatase 2 isoform X1 n=1 Tax=Rhizophora mucronata TaxID=61149 RepID=A0A2P2LED4_RHIMU